MKRLLLVYLVLAGFNMHFAHADQIPTIAVAANMSYTIEEIVAEFKKEAGQNVKISYGSSGNLTRQIMQGAPFEVFLSASQLYTQKLVERNLTIGQSKVYAIGRLCLFIPKNSRLNKANTLTDVISQLSHGNFARISMANPDHAPYGQAAMTALQRAGVWAYDRSKIVMGENVSQATQFTISGSVDAGLIPYSHALLANVKEHGKCYLIPEYWHEPIEQHMVLLTSSGVIAKRFFQYLASAKAKEVLTEHGYELPANNNAN